MCVHVDSSGTSYCLLHTSVIAYIINDAQEARSINTNNIGGRAHTYIYGFIIYGYSA